MRVPPFSRMPLTMFGFACLLLGCIVGAAFYQAGITQLVSSVHHRNELLRAERDELQARLAEADKQRSTSTFIASVRVYLEQQEDSMIDLATTARLKEAVRRSVRSLLGTSVYDIDEHAKIVRTLVDEHASVDGYRLHITTMLVADRVLHVWFVTRSSASE